MHNLLWYRTLNHSGPRSESKFCCWKRITGSAVLPQSHFAYLSQASVQHGRWPRNGRHERKNGTVERRKARLEENRHADIWISHSISARLLNWTTIKMAFCTQANTTENRLQSAIGNDFPSKTCHRVLLASVFFSKLVTLTPGVNR